MGFGFNIADTTTVFMRKHRWLFKIPEISAEGVDALPPFKGARPSLSFKELEANHLTETIYFPGRADWKPIPLTLYELKRAQGSGHNPIWKWIKEYYDPKNESKIKPSAEGFKKPQAILELYDGIGNACETWIFETIWLQSIEFGDLDMGNADIITCDLTLRFDRAYLQEEELKPAVNNPLGGGGGGEAGAVAAGIAGGIFRSGGIF